MVCTPSGEAVHPDAFVIGGKIQTADAEPIAQEQSALFAALQIQQ
jgi:hypothetical protein